MRFLLYFPIILSILCCCSTKNHKSESSALRTIAIIDTLPFPSNDGSNKIFYPPHERLLIYYYDDYAMYRISQIRTDSWLSFKNDSTIESTPYKQDTFG